MFKDRSYVEWREVVAPAVRQELGDATYPACNTAGTCADKGLDGHGATDVWLAEGVDPTDAVLGFREGTRTVVLFVERGTDPGTVADDLDPALLG